MEADEFAKFEARFHVEPNTSCWLWVGVISVDGYGVFSYRDNKHRGAHRVAYEHFRGPIPAGLELDHLCRQRCCCNPDHLEAVTREENIRRGIVGDNSRSKTHCPAGHPYEGHNLGLYFRAGRAGRRCKACHRVQQQAYRERHGR